METKTTEAKRKAIYKYDDKFERINCRLAKGTKDRIKALKYSAKLQFILYILLYLLALRLKCTKLQRQHRQIQQSTYS